MEDKKFIKHFNWSIWTEFLKNLLTSIKEKIFAVNDSVENINTKIGTDPETPAKTLFERTANINEEVFYIYDQTEDIKNKVGTATTPNDTLFKAIENIDVDLTPVTDGIDDIKETLGQPVIDHVVDGDKLIHMFGPSLVDPTVSKYIYTDQATEEDNPLFIPEVGETYHFTGATEDQQVYFTEQGTQGYLINGKYYTLTETHQTDPYLMYLYRQSDSPESQNITIAEAIDNVDIKVGAALDELSDLNSGEGTGVIIGQGVVEDIAVIRQGLEPVINAATAYNDGKSLVAQAVTNRGIPTDPSASFTTIANNIAHIQDTQIPSNWYITNSSTQITDYKQLISDRADMIIAINDPQITELQISSLAKFTALQSLNLPNLQYISYEGYQGQAGTGLSSTVTSVSFPELIADYENGPITTSQCSHVSFPKLESSNLLGSCTFAQSLDLPSLKYIGNRPVTNAGNVWPYTTPGTLGLSFLSNVNIIETIELPSLEAFSVNNACSFVNAGTALKSIILPSLHYIQIANSNRYFITGSCPELRKLVIGSLDTNPVVIPTSLDVGKNSNGSYNTFPTNSFSTDNTPNLIHIELLNPTDTCIRMVGWQPQNAMSNISNSLVEEGETFANNREKLLYNLRTLFAAKLVQNTAQKNRVIAFKKVLYDILDSETLQAFTDKGYTVTGV